MIEKHTIDKFNMMNNYLMYQYGMWLCFGLIVTGFLPETQKNKPQSNSKIEKA